MTKIHSNSEHVAVLSYNSTSRKSLDIDVVRDRTSLYREPLSSIENSYTIITMHKAQHAQTVSTEGLDTSIFLAQCQRWSAGTSSINNKASQTENFQEGYPSFSIVILNENYVKVSSYPTFMFK